MASKKKPVRLIPKRYRLDHGGINSPALPRLVRRPCWSGVLR
jgi:hypothetical protein